MTVSYSINGVNMSKEEIEKIPIYCEALNRAVYEANKRLRKSMFSC